MHDTERDRIFHDWLTGHNGICPMALVLLGLRVNQMAFSDNAFMVVSTA